jgi:hypothetical protein
MRTKYHIQPIGGGGTKQGKQDIDYYIIHTSSSISTETT